MLHDWSILRSCQDNQGGLFVQAEWQIILQKIRRCQLFKWCLWLFRPVYQEFRLFPPQCLLLLRRLCPTGLLRVVLRLLLNCCEIDYSAKLSGAALQIHHVEGTVVERFFWHQDVRVDLPLGLRGGVHFYIGINRQLWAEKICDACAKQGGRAYHIVVIL